MVIVVLLLVLRYLFYSNSDTAVRFRRFYNKQVRAQLLCC